MDIVFKKISYEDYLSQVKTLFRIEDEHWIKIQYDYLKEPSWIEGRTYELYCPDNFYIPEEQMFVIPTGFRCVSKCDKPKVDVLIDTGNPVFVADQTESHIMLCGTMGKNSCFTAGQPILRLTFE